MFFFSLDEFTNNRMTTLCSILYFRPYIVFVAPPPLERLKQMRIARGEAYKVRYNMRK